MTISSFSRRTIFALASHVSHSGSPLALIRISGPDSHPAVRCLIRQSLSARRATRCRISDPQTGDLVDEAIAISYPEPGSYTGEHVCELMVHGSNAVVARLLCLLGQRPGLRPAEAGEFTKRALLNGKLDLTAAEAVKDLIESRTEVQRKRAVDALSGRTSDLYRNWRQRLIQSLANLEANIEFGEDQLIEDETFVHLVSGLNSLKSEIGCHVENACRKSDIALQGLRVVIMGEVNVGKSSLINALTSRDVSIVSSIKGTTRDAIDVLLDVKGHLITLSDTAGLREEAEADPIELEGMRRAKLKARNAHLILSVTDHQSRTPDAEIEEILRHNDRVAVLHVRNKGDLISCLPPDTSSSLSPADYIVSCKTGDGIDDLEAGISEHIQKLYSHDESAFITERQRCHLQNVVQYIDLSLRYIQSDVSLASHYLKKAALHVSSLTDAITGDQVLDQIFRDFCIGK